MDVKGAKALSERLAEASRHVDLPPSKAVNSVDTSDSASQDADTTAKGVKGDGVFLRDRRSHIPVGRQFRGLRASI
jgi:hypothetical protein